VKSRDGESAVCDFLEFSPAHVTVRRDWTRPARGAIIGRSPPAAPATRPNAMPILRPPFRFLPLVLALAAGAAPAQDAMSPSTGAWQFLRPQFYGDRDIGEVDEAAMRIEAPGSTPDPSATPVTLHFGKDAIGAVRKVRVIIDNNPSPVASTIDIAEGVPVDEIDLRVRVDRFTSVRAIAEMADGRLEMRSAWIKASGGCSAPPAATGEGKTGDVRFRGSPDGKSLQVSIRHPNASGFQIDPVTGDPIPPHYVSHLDLKSGDKTLISVDSGISISENPTFRIVSDKPLATPLTLEATDSKDAHFSATWNGAEPAHAPAAP
jgi:sulfur-oxidizing protein SoxY